MGSPAASTGSGSRSSGRWRLYRICYCGPPVRPGADNPGHRVICVRTSQTAECERRRADPAGTKRWVLTTSDADFFVKMAILLAEEHRMQGGMFSHDQDFGPLAYAVELHLESRGEA